MSIRRQNDREKLRGPRGERKKESGEKEIGWIRGTREGKGRGGRQERERERLGVNGGVDATPVEPLQGLQDGRARLLGFARRFTYRFS